ncbi:MAG: glycosyltransferase family 1 protein [Candidatus ainarchaeum sp.]|nr:glycosyltransferase family 1 protein [Candidatus ainarchaeum sp.]
MNVLFDHQAFWYQRFGGVSRYFSCLMDSALRNNIFQFENSVLYSNNVFINDCSFIKNKSFFLNTNFIGKNKLFFILNYINKKNSLNKLHSSTFDVFHPTYFDTYYLNNLKIPFVLTFHDLTMEKFSSLFFEKVLFKNEKRLLLDNVSRVIAVSKNTKSDLIEYYGFDKNKVDVIYHGANLDRKMAKKPMFKFPENFILFVGARDNYKNFNFFVSAIKDIIKSTKNLSLVCIGNSFSQDELSFLRDVGVLKKTFCFNVNDNELAYLYSKAKFFVYPSLYEGFGLPILEAFNCGCPVALSKTSCFPEIAQKNALYFDPYNKESIKNCVEDLIINEKKRQLLSKKGLKRAKDFSWKKCAKETKKVYQKAIK